MTTIVFVTDPHLSEETPKSRTDDWPTTVLGKFAQVGEICREVDADACVWGGDTYNLKAPDRTPHRLQNRLAKTLIRFPCKHWSCVGNHDCKWQDIKFLPEQPLETLFSTGVFNRLYDEHEADIWAGGLNDPTVRVVGIPYHGVKYNLDKFRAIERKDESYLMCVAHVLASKNQASMFDREDVIRHRDLLELAPDVDVWCFGHWHKNQGITEIADGKWVVNIGSLTRGVLTQDEMDRVPVCAILRFGDKIEIEQRALKIQPAKEVFDLEKRVAVEAREMTMNSFVEKLQKTISRAKGKDFAEDIAAMKDVPSIVRERCLGYMEQAQNGKV